MNHAPHDCLPAGDINGDGIDDVYLAFRVFSDVFEDRRVYSGADGATLVQLADDILVTRDYSYKFLGDLDGDGVGEYVRLQQDRVVPPALVATSRIQLYSGTDLIPRFDINGAGLVPGATVLQSRNVSVNGVGDLDGDGIKDIAYAWRYQSPTTGPSLSTYAMSLVSGADGSSIHNFVGVDAFYRAATDLADINGDGVADYAIGTDVGFNVPNAGTVFLISGSNHAIIRTIHGTVGHERLGRALEGIDDLDGDGLQDVVALSSGNHFIPGGVIQGRLTAYSSGTGAMIWTRMGTQSSTPHDLTPAGDVNGDGIVDFGVRHFAGLFLSSAVSGADGSLIDITPAPSVASTGIIPAEYLAGDTNGDGIGEIAYPLVATVPMGASDFLFTQRLGAAVYGQGTAGATLTFEFEPFSSSVSAGRIVLDAATPNAGLLIALSLEPWNGDPFSAIHPLWISPLPGELLLTTIAAADGLGQFEAFVNLRQPSIAGVVVYLQAAQTSAPEAVSNGLEILFSN